MNEIEAMITAWRGKGVLLNGPASDGDLSRLAELIDGNVPSDLRLFYGSINGMHDNETDECHVSFWSIDRLIRERDIVERDNRHWIAFADFLVYSWCFRIAAEAERTRVFDDSTGEEFGSLFEFFGRYIADPDSLDLVRAG